MNIDEQLEKMARTIETLEQTEARHNDAADVRLTRVEKALEKLTIENTKLNLTVRKMGKYAMVIARLHDDELGSHTKRLLALEQEDGPSDSTQEGG